MQQTLNSQNSQSLIKTTKLWCIILKSICPWQRWTSIFKDFFAVFAWRLNIWYKLKGHNYKPKMLAFFIFQNLFYFWYPIKVSKKILINHISKLSFTSLAFWQLVKLCIIWKFLWKSKYQFCLHFLIFLINYLKFEAILSGVKHATCSKSII
jgi:hypothetical protein